MGQVDNSAAEEAAADAPDLRGRIKLFSAPDNQTFPANSSSPLAGAPQRYLPDDCGAGPPGNCGGGAPTATTWYEANSTSVKRYSALCYLVAREMVRKHSDTTTVWGLVQSAKGGTPVEGWLAGDKLERFSKCGMDPSCPIFSQGAEPADGSKFYTEWSRPSVLYNQMMAPIAGYQALAVLWDQGEANMDEGFMLRREQYSCLFREMIASWYFACCQRLWPEGAVSLTTVLHCLQAAGLGGPRSGLRLPTAARLRLAKEQLFELPVLGRLLDHNPIRPGRCRPDRW